MAEKVSSSDDEPTIAEDVVVTKYKMAGDMANKILRLVVAKCVMGAAVVEICEMGDKLILEETGKVYKKEKEMKKGIAFPTSISINNCVCHFSPLRSEAATIIGDGDLVKIELGVHVDGFIATVGHTVIVGSSVDKKAMGRKADVVKAAYLASEIAHRMVIPGGGNMAVTDAIQKVATSFQCNSVEGILCSQLKKNSCDSEKTIILNPTEQQRREHKTCEFAMHEAYAIDVIVSTGEGKSRMMDARTTIFKRTEEVYKLKMKASRAFYSEISSKYSVMPFSLRSFEEEGKARMGIVECVNHNLVEPFNVLYEKEGEYVAQFKFTVLLMANGPLRITSGPFNSDTLDSSLSLQDEELKALLATSATRKKKKKKKKVVPAAAVAGLSEEVKPAADHGSKDTLKTAVLANSTS